MLQDFPQGKDLPGHEPPGVNGGNPIGLNSQTTKASHRGLPLVREIVSLLVALLLVLFVAFDAFRAWSSFGEQSDQLAVTQEIIQKSSQLLADVTDAETGQRGFLLTGAQRYLAPYDRSSANVWSSLDRLAQVTATRANQAERVEKLRPLVKEKLDELQATIEARRKLGPEAALEIVQMGRGRALMDQIRQLCTEMQSVAYARLLRQTTVARSSVNEIALVSVVGSLALFALLVLSVITIQRSIARRAKNLEILKASEESARIAQDWLRTTLESIGDGIIATDAQGGITIMNKVAQSLTGWSGEEALGRELDRVYVAHSEETGQLVENQLTRVLRHGGVGGSSRSLLTSRDGASIAIEESPAPIRDASGGIVGVVVAFRDITERLRVERLERQSALDLAWLGAIVESSGDAIIGENLDGRVTSWNPAAQCIFGYTKVEMIGQPISTISSSGREDEGIRILERIARGEHINQFETVRRTKDGREIHVALTVAPIRDESGNVIGASKTAHDITERIVADEVRRKQEEQLLRSNVDLQRFAYAASHDLREPLRTISVYSQLLERHSCSQLDAEGLSNLKSITAATVRMAQLIDGLLEYSKVDGAGRSSAANVDTTSALGAAVANLRAAIESTGALLTFEPLPVVKGSQMNFIQLFQNLIGNGLKYRSSRPPAIHIAAERSGREWLFSVSDNGQGIAAEYQLQIFELFKRLHGQDYPGSGIGLATCRKIVETLGGRIWVESEPAVGSTFYFTLPAQENTP
ncbi:MAG: PAS domain S-box protein [Bryobacteraceae bacterium]